jgi:enamine deaminase RidA (YjgF/YER057c/UK114 family)
MTITRLNPGVRYSMAVVHGDTVYVAGQIAEDPKANITAQTRSVLKRIDAALKAAGTNKSKLLACTVYLSDIRNFEAMNKVWDAWVDKKNLPARATVEARLATPLYLVEIVAIAAR